MTIGERIRKIRNEKGLTQKSLGEKCGINEAQIRHYEIGKSTPKIATVEKIATGLGVSVTDLLYDATVDSAENLKKTLLDQVKEIFQNYPDDPKPYLELVLKSSIEMTEKTIAQIKENDLKQKILEPYEKLNDEGKQKAVEYTTDLAQMEKYQKKEDN